MADRVVRALLRYDVDGASVQRVERSLSEITEQQNRATRSIGEMGDYADRRIRSVEQYFAATSRRAERLTEDMNDLTRATREYGNEAERVENDGQTSRGLRRAAGATRETPVTNRIDRAGRVAGQIASGLGAGEVANVVGLVGDAADAIGSLGPVAIVATGAVAGLSIGMGVLNQALRPITRTLEGAIAAQDAYYQAVRGFTTAETRQRIAELQRSNEIARAQLQETRNSIDSNLSGIGQTLINGLAGFGEAGSQAIVRLSAVADDLEKEIAANEQTILRLQLGLEAEAFAANDLEQAERALADARQRAVAVAEAARQAELAAQQQQQRNIGSFISNWSERPRNEIQLEIARLQGEALRLQNLIVSSSGRLSEATLDVFRQQLTLIRAQQEALDEVVLPQAGQGSRLLQALRGIAQSGVDLLQGLGKVADVDAEFREKRVEAATRINERIAEIQAAADERVVETTREYNLERVRNEEDVQRSIARVIRSAASRLLETVGFRDALGNLQARRQRDERIRDLNEDARVERQRRAEDFGQRMRDLVNQTAKQINLERNRGQLVLIELQKQQASQLLALRNTFVQRNQIESMGYSAALTNAQRFVNGLIGLFTSGAAARPAFATSPLARSETERTVRQVLGQIVVER